VDQAAEQDIVACIVNGRAGSDRAALAAQHVAQLFEQRDVPVQTVVVEDGRQLTPIARRYAEDGCRTIVAAGGDGTVSAVASALVGTKSALGVLPLGTLNHFAKDMNIPLELDAAVWTILNGVSTQVDVGEVNGRTFVNNSSIGLYPAIVRERSAEQSRGMSKWLAFIRAVYKVMRRCPSFYASVHANSVLEPTDKTPFIFVGNNRYETHGLRIGERDRLDGGHLWVCRAPGADRAALIRLAVRAVLRKTTLGELKILEADELWVHTRRNRRLKVANDGEVFTTRAPLHYRILPKSLRVIVPPGAEEA
jgi:YegS/Rv2252/BmrU family lipid kinase